MITEKRFGSGSKIWKCPAHPLCGPAQATPVPMFCCTKEILQELEHSVRSQPSLVGFKVLLKFWTLHTSQKDHLSAPPRWQSNFDCMQTGTISL